MLAHKRFSFIVICAFAVFCLGIGCKGVAHAQHVGPTLEERTGRPLVEVQSHLREYAEAIVNDYMEGIKALGDSGGAPLTGFRITNVNTTNLQNLTVTVIPAYRMSGTTAEEFPATDYHLIPVDENYQVQKQLCVYNMDPKSAGYKTVHCSLKWITGQDGSVAVTTP